MRAAAIATMLASVACGAQAPTMSGVRSPADSAFVASLRSYLETATAADEFAGAVLVMRDGRTMFEGAYGLADRERGVANTPATRFRVGSMYKMVTAVAAMQLVQAGRMRLDTPLGAYLGDYPNAAIASTVTPHHLLTHTGGTGDIFGPLFTQHRTTLRSVADYVQLYGQRAPQFEAGSRHVYSNYGFMLLGALIERLAAKDYDQHVTARVLGPAGMGSTGTQPEDVAVPGRAVGYLRQGGSWIPNAATLPYRGTPAGGGYSTVGDFARFAEALRAHRLLDRAHTDMLLSGKVDVAPGFRYAYGFTDRVVAGRRLVGHGGGAPGMNGDLAFEPDGGYVVVVLSNLDPPAAQRVSTYILNRLPQ